MRVAVAEDSAIIRDGLVALLEGRGVEVCGAVGDGDSLIALVDQDPPDVVISDIRMPPGHSDEGLRAALRIKRDHPTTGVLLFSQYAETRYARMLLDASGEGVGYLLKDRVADVSTFIESVRQVAAGHVVLDPEVVASLLGRRPAGGPLAGLTERELDILRLMAEGRSNSAIGAALFLSPGTVEKHITAVFAKLALPASSVDHRRVLAVLRYLAAGHSAA
ncbi:response regulator transcription factor [Agromyces sp. NPDC056379]|uniref:response regulator transcription factor n=1 Tax=unclassified Agromyces TaxID=2639701 RepID=UPI0035E1954A